MITQFIIIWIWLTLEAFRSMVFRDNGWFSPTGLVIGFWSKSPSEDCLHSLLSNIHLTWVVLTSLESLRQHTVVKTHALDVGSRIGWWYNWPRSLMPSVVCNNKHNQIKFFDAVKKLGQHLLFVDTNFWWTCLHWRQFNTLEFKTLQCNTLQCNTKLA